MTAQCTPEYNAKTREMMDQLEKLKATARNVEHIVKGRETGDFGEAIRAKAKEVVAGGETDAGKVVDKVHKYINEYEPHTKGEVADAIAAKATKRKQSEVQQKLQAVRDELRDLSDVQGKLGAEGKPEVVSDKATRTRLTNEIADLERQIEHGVSNAKAETGKMTSPEVQALRDKRDALKVELDQNTNPPPAIYPKDLNESKNKAQQTALKNAIADLDRRIANRDLSEKQGHKFKPDDTTQRLKAERAAKAKELDQMQNPPPATRPVNPMDAKNKTRISALQKQEATLKAQVDSGHIEPTPKREKPQYNEEVFASQARVNKLRKQREIIIEKGRLANRSLPEKIADTGIKIQRLFILSHLSAFQKLPVAAIVRIVAKHAEAGAGSLLRLIPIIKQIDANAPRHGGGYSWQGDAVQGARGIGDALRKGMKDQLINGADKIDNLYGNNHQSSDEWANLSGRVHSMMKEPAKMDEFYTSFYKRSQHAYKDALKRLGSEDAAQEYVNRPSTQFAIGEAAYKDAREAIMQGDNQLVDAIDNGLRHLSSSNVGGKIFEKFFNLLVPIKKVPANIIKETSSNAIGGIKAAVAARHGWEKLTPEQSDYVIKNLKKQTVGIPIMVAGYLAGSTILGGLEDVFEDSKKSVGEYYKRLRGQQPLAGHIKIGKTDLNPNFSHASQLSIAQAGAQFRAMREKEKDPSFFGGMRDLLQIAGSYVADEGPVIGALTKSYRYGEKDRKLESVAGSTIAGAVVPGAFQDYAKYQDYDSSKDKNTNSQLGHFLDLWGGQFSAKTRHSKSIPEDVMKVTPGLRKNVPVR